MNINITSRKIHLKEQFNERVEKKLSKLEKFFIDEANAFVTVSRESERFIVEITIKYNGIIFRAEKETTELFDSLEGATDLIIKQIVKNKKRLERNFSESSFEFDDAYADYSSEGDDSYEVVKTKSLEMKPMDIEEAILQLNMIGHQFYMFENARTGQINVIYKRNQHGYGLLEPDVE